MENAGSKRVMVGLERLDRKSTRLNSSHLGISYAVFCLKKKNTRLNSSHLGISYALLCLKNKTPPLRPGSQRASSLLLRSRTQRKIPTGRRRLKDGAVLY